MIGVRYLRQAAVIFDAAADDAFCARRQQALQLIALHIEIDKRQGARAIAEQD